MILFGILSTAGFFIFSFIAWLFDDDGNPIMFISLVCAFLSMALTLSAWNEKNVEVEKVTYHKRLSDDGK